MYILLNIKILHTMIFGIPLSGTLEVQVVYSGPNVPPLSPGRHLENLKGGCYMMTLGSMPGL